MKSSLLGYRRILDKARLGKTQRNWFGHETCLKRRVQKLFGKSTCFNQVREPKETGTGGRTPSVKGPKFMVGGDKPVKSVMFVPFTLKGELWRRGACRRRRVS